MNHIELNNAITRQKDGFYDLEKDQEALKVYLEEVQENTKEFPTELDRLSWLVENDFYFDCFSLYDEHFLKDISAKAYTYNFKFASYMAATKFYQSYALKTNDKKTYLENYEQHMVIVALYLAQGDNYFALELLDTLMTQVYQPATPTMLNAGRSRRGELVSCYLLSLDDSLNSINYNEGVARTLSKYGGGVALNLSRLRARGESIKEVENCAKGVIPVAKSLEMSFQYADQLGQRPGAGAVYLNAFHADLPEFLDTKKVNADEGLRLATISTGLIVPDKFMELAKKNQPFYMFYPHNVYKHYGIHLDDMNMSEMYDVLVADPNIKKREGSARDILNQVAKMQLQSGYPYLMFKDNANKVHALKEIGDIHQSNLCVSGDTKILTKEYGYVDIETVSGQDLHVWNGQEWSLSPIRKTGEGQELVRVTLSNGMYLDCTPYHKFYVQNGYGTEPEEVRASEMKPGDKLIKFELPDTERTASEFDYEYAYHSGFFTGDGTNVKPNRGEEYDRIYLYDDKRNLEPVMDKLPYTSKQSQDMRITYNIKKGTLLPKFTLPYNKSINYKLNWLSGLLDADGALTNNDGCLSLQLTSVNKKFLQDLLLFLQELGIYSRVSDCHPEGKRLLPTHVGDEYAEYECQATYRLLISHKEIEKLLELGLELYRIQLPTEIKSTNRQATHFITVTSIDSLPGEHDTYCFNESKHAQVVNLKKYGIEHPALIKKSDGATLYITRDLAAALYRKNEYQFAKSIYVVGQEQSAHFKQLKAVLQEMGYDWSQDIVHVPFGLVTKEGKKLSTRKGNVILLEPTVAEAISRAKAQIEAKNPELENKDQVAHAVGVGAIKFYDLKTDRTNGYDFDLEAMVSFEGETGPYVQYAYARIQSILRKADFKPEAGANYSLNDAESWEIIKLIQDFPRIIKRAADNYEPSIIAKFAISLAQAFNKYYAHTRILDESPERDSRLALSYATAVVLKEALRLLGVEAPEKM